MAQLILTKLTQDADDNCFGVLVVGDVEVGKLAMLYHGGDQSFTHSIAWNDDADKLVPACFPWDAIQLDWSAAVFSALRKAMRIMDADFSTFFDPMPGTRTRIVVSEHHDPIARHMALHHH